MNKYSSRIQILGSNIDNLSMDETMAVIDHSIDNKTPILHTVVNAAKIVAMKTNLELRQSVNEADLINADGMAVVWASKFLKKPLKERVSGIDLFTNLVERAAQKGRSVYLLGAKEEVVTAVANKFQSTYGATTVAGYQHGYFSKEEELSIVQQIVDSKASYLFVAMSSPKKELFLHGYREMLSSVGFIMGVGGSFDVVSGKVKRAPSWMQNLGLEWFYRFIQEPKRMWKRSFIENGKFVIMVFKERFSN